MILDWWHRNLSLIIEDGIINSRFHSKHIFYAMGKRERERKNGHLLKPYSNIFHSGVKQCFLVCWAGIL
jgi:hypothetical protein